MGDQPRYKSVIIKLSGEALMGDQSFGIDEPVAQRIAEEIKEVHELVSRPPSSSAAATSFAASRRAPAASTG